MGGGHGFCVGLGIGGGGQGFLVVGGGGGGTTCPLLLFGRTWPL